MTDDLPPLGPYNWTMRTCSRVLGHVDHAELLCGESATEHVIYWWDDHGFDHGFCCAKHWTDYQTRWTAASHHQVNAACGMPGSHVHFNGERSWCSQHDLPVAEPARTEAVAA